MAISPVAETTCGRVEGLYRDGTHVFMGIPFARAPVGELRFRPPQPPEPWAGVRLTQRSGPIPLQPPSPLEATLGTQGFTQGEDCLSLNVWTPGLDGQRRPVMVWVHGGMFVTGTGASKWYSGRTFATSSDVVVVTLNYRLGAIGFLHLAQVAGEEYASSGNCGLLDQLAALEWVRDNVAAFGGDPANVTVFGESAGAMSVGGLLGVPRAQGLFCKAILQSGACANVRAPEVAAEVTEELLADLGIRAGAVAALAAMPGAQLIEAQERVTTRRLSTWATPGALPFSPVVDGISLPRPPLEAVAGGSAAGVRMAVGTNRDEMTLFTLVDPTMNSLNEAGLERQATVIFGATTAAKAVEVYRVGRPRASPGQVWVAMLTDAIFRTPAIRLAEAQSLHQPATFMYLFTWPTPVFGGMLGASHGLEVAFVFDTVDQPGVNLLVGEGPHLAPMATRMHRAWAAFARHGVPDVPAGPGSERPEWPAYETTRRSTMTMDETWEVTDDPGRAERLVSEEAAVAPAGVERGPTRP